MSNEELPQDFDIVILGTGEYIFFSFQLEFKLDQTYNLKETVNSV